MSTQSVQLDGPLDLVLPVYNEARVLTDSVERLQEAAAAWDGYPQRILIVDNASVDTTPEVGRRLAEQYDAVEFLRLERKGRGYALRRAWTETDAAYSLYMDIDLSTGLEAVPDVVGELHRGADLVTGSRLDRRSRVARSLKREILSRGYNHLVRWLFWSREFSDAQCGFKAVRLATIRPLLPKVVNNHWFFDTELLLLAEYAGLKVRSIPIVWNDDPDTRVKILSTAMEDLKGLARLRRTLRATLRKDGS